MTDPLHRSAEAEPGLAFRFAGARMIARGSGALFWPEQGALIVADLHLGKSERMARRGGALLPPFETRDTLARLGAEIDALGPRLIVLLGDVFDDDAALAALNPADLAAFGRIGAGAELLVLAGNHDRKSGPETAHLGGIALRHIAGQGPDISGHYHPKIRLGPLARPAFLVGAEHLILPAFGTYTGGLWHDAPVLSALVPQGVAIMTGRRPLALPIGAGRG
ncbi:MAG: ligase-associated DNA damage response endonuclease PdeM [Paracoccus sp. (in: a-proteobacteria)]|nr:ligase-associated DNA damage response endonuclease PdeM [Paracoccus sp. (in: a-proteobacteria)]